MRRDQVHRLAGVGGVRHHLEGWVSHGERLLRQHSALERALREESATARAATDSVIRVCSWCQSIAGPDDVWIPLKRLPVPTGHLAVSHGVCPTCRAPRTG